MSIDTTFPVTGTSVSKSLERANWAAALDGIDTLDIAESGTTLTVDAASFGDHRRLRVRFTSSSPVTVTLDSDVPAGRTLEVVQYDTGNVSVVAGSGATLVGPASIAAVTGGQYESLTLHVDTNSGSDAQWRLVAGATTTTGGGGSNKVLWTGGLAGMQGQFDEGGVWDAGVLDWADAAGLNPQFIRFNFIRKSSTEPSPGVYDFSQYDSVVSKLNDLGWKHVMVVFYGSASWDSDYSGFAAWTEAAMVWHVQNYPGVLAAIEIWNEPDGSWPVSASEYILMAQAIRTKIDANPLISNITVCSAATYSGADTTYWNSIIAGGILDLIDMVSFHYYGAAEGIIANFAPLYTAISAAGKANLPIFLSEWGDYGYGGNEDQIARRLSCVKSMGFVASSYFPMMDYSAFPDGGLIDSSGNPKDETDAWVEWFSEIGNGAEYQSRDQLTSVAYSFVFLKNGTLVRHMWATTDTDITIDGVATTLTIPSIYVHGDVTIALDLSGDVLLANVADFDYNAQGAPWYYIYRDNSDSGETNMTANVPSARWEGPTSSCYCRSDAHQAPSTTYKAVKRYVVPAGVTRIKVDGGVTRSQAGGDGTLVRLMHNTTVRFSRTLTTGFPTFEQIFDVSSGDHIDFETGSGGSDSSYDDIKWQSGLVYSTADSTNSPDIA